MKDILKNLYQPTQPLTHEVPHASQTQYRSKSLKFTLLMLVPIFLFLGGVYILFVSLTQSNVSPNPLTQALTSPPPDPTANWKTYTSKSFSFKYPSEWTMNGQFALSGKSPNIELIASEDENLYNECMRELIPERFNNFVRRKFEADVSGDSCYGGDKSLRESWVVRNEDSYGPGIIVRYSIEDTNIETLIDQILSTFKFLDSATILDISNGKTFTSRYGYSLKYPSEWETHTSDWEEDEVFYGPQLDDEAVIFEPNKRGYGTVLSLKIPKDNPQNLSASEWVETNVLPTFSKDYPEILVEFKENLMDVTIQNILSIISHTNLGGTDVYIPYKGKVYEINYNPYQSSNIYEKVFDQILSSINFTQ